MERDGVASGHGQVRLLASIVPLVGLAILFLLRWALLQIWPPLAVELAIGMLVAAGVVVFSWSIFRVIDQQDARLAAQYDELEQRYASERRLRAQLEALHKMALAITSAQTPAQTLQQLVELARHLIGARYAALGVLGPQGAIDAFHTAGLTSEERARLGPLPHEHGVLAAALTPGQPVRMHDVATDPHSLGFPSGHPVVHSMLAVPVEHAGHVVGNLYLTDKIGATAFSDEDEWLVSLLASHAAAVIERARLGDQVRTLAVEAERARIRRDLHDGTIQAIYGVNLELEGAADDVESDPAVARTRIDTAIERLGDVMRDIRRYISGLGSDNPPPPEPEADMLDDVYVRALRAAPAREGEASNV